MSTRLMEHPQYDIEGDEEILIRFRVDGSSLGYVEIVLDLDEVDIFLESLEQARLFARAPQGDSPRSATK